MRQIEKARWHSEIKGIRSAREIHRLLDADDEWLRRFLPKTTAKLESGIYQWADCAANCVVFNNKEEIIDKRLFIMITINLDDKFICATA